MMGQGHVQGQWQCVILSGGLSLVTRRCCGGKTQACSGRHEGARGKGWEGRLSTWVRITGDQAKIGPYKESGLFSASMSSH